MDKPATTDKDAPKTTTTRDQRLEAMRERLLALPSKVALRPEDLETNLDFLESSEDLESSAQLIAGSGYGIRR